MTTYSFIDESGETRLVGTISPAPGGGSQPMKGPYTFTFAGNLTAYAAAAGVELFTPSVGDLILPFRELVTPWNNEAEDLQTVYVNTGALSGDGTLMKPGNSQNPLSSPMWQDEGDITGFDESGDLAVVGDPTSTSWPPGTNGSPWSNMIRVRVASPICARFCDQNGDPIGTDSSGSPTVGESRLYFLVYSPSA